MWSPLCRIATEDVRGPLQLSGSCTRHTIESNCRNVCDAVGFGSNALGSGGYRFVSESICESCRVAACARRKIPSVLQWGHVDMRHYSVDVRVTTQWNAQNQQVLLVFCCRISIAVKC